MLEIGIIKTNSSVAKTIWEMTLSVPEIAKKAKPGQFVNLRLTENWIRCSADRSAFIGLIPKKDRLRCSIWLWEKEPL